MRQQVTAVRLGAGVGALVTARHGGVSTGPFAGLNLSDLVGDGADAVAANRDELAGTVALAGGPGRLAWMRQVHGTEVADLTGPAAGAGFAAGCRPEADAMFTDSRQVALGVQVADCAPVLLADPDAGLVGVAHAGRPGLAAGVVPALSAAMTKAGADPGRMRALLGPMICGGCYEVPAALRDEVGGLVPGSACVTRKGTAGIDIRAGLRGQLAACGISSVDDDLRCTAESAELYSYRRDGVTGRFAGLIWLVA